MVMLQACNDRCSKVNTSRFYRNTGLPKGCSLIGDNLPYTAKVRGYSTKNGKSNGDGVSIVSSCKIKTSSGKVRQLNISTKSTVGSNTHRLLVKNESNQKMISRNLYHDMFNEEYYKNAYESIKSRGSSMTPGSDKETFDGLSTEKIKGIIESLKDRSFQFKPSKRITIMKPDGKERNLGIPSATDKLVQRVMKDIIEGVYEPIFLNSSHGFRPNRGTHTALEVIRT